MLIFLFNKSVYKTFVLVYNSVRTNVRDKKGDRYYYDE